MLLQTIYSVSVKTFIRSRLIDRCWVRSTSLKTSTSVDVPTPFRAAAKFGRGMAMKQERLGIGGNMWTKTPNQCEKNRLNVGASWKTTKQQYSIFIKKNSLCSMVFLTLHVVLPGGFVCGTPGRVFAFSH